MFTTFAGGWPSLVLWMFHRSWHSSVVLGEACALDVNTFLLLLSSEQYNFRTAFRCPNSVSSTPSTYLSRSENVAGVAC